MVEVVVYDLHLNDKEIIILKDLLGLYNDAAKMMSSFLDVSQQYNQIVLCQMYRKQLQDSFGLPSSIAESIIIHVLDEYRECAKKNKQPTLPNFDNNNEMKYTQNTCSIIMPALHPAHISKYPYRCSITTHTSRLKIPFTRTFENYTKNINPNEIKLIHQNNLWRVIASIKSEQRTAVL